MVSTSSRSRTAPSLGVMHTPDFLRNCMGIRITRTHLLASGQHVDLSTLAEWTGFSAKVFLRREAFEKLTETPESWRENEHDLYTTMFAMREAIMRAPLRDCPVRFQVGDIALVAHIGNVDHDDPRSAITVALACKQED